MYTDYIGSVQKQVHKCTLHVHKCTHTHMYVHNKMYTTHMYMYVNKCTLDTCSQMYTTHMYMYVYKCTQM